MVNMCCGLSSFSAGTAANGDTPTLTCLSVMGPNLCLCSLRLVSKVFRGRIN